MSMTATAEVEPSDEPAPPRPHLELFTQEQLEAHAARLSAEHRVAADGRDAKPFISRIEEIGRKLDETYRFLNATARAPQPVPSEDWLRDNHFVVQDQLRAVRHDLPRKFYLELPKLVDGRYVGLPRVFALASELVVRTAGRLDLQSMIGFVAAYQQAVPLSIGEIWAFSVMLRVALLEALEELAADVAVASRDREEARRWGAQLAKSPADAAGTLSASLGAAGERGHLSNAFVVELLQWLRDQPGEAAPAWEVLERELAAKGNSAEAMLRAEHSREAASQLAIGNIITSMRLVGSIDWPTFFERISTVERILREDPAGAYAAMDFPTRDRYRHSIEELARRSGKTELEVARCAVDLAREAQRTPEGQRPAASRRLFPDLARPFEARDRRRLSGRGPRTAVAVHLPSSGRRLSGDDRGFHQRRADELPDVRGAARRDGRRAVADRPDRAAADRRRHHQPAQSAGDDAGAAAAAAEARPAQGDPGGRPDVRGRAGDHRHRGARRRADRRPRGAVPRQSRAASPLRAAHGFSGRRPGLDAGGRGAGRARPHAASPS